MARLAAGALARYPSPPMDGQNKPALVALRSRRDQVIQQLSEQFAADALDMVEFEQRLDRAHAATDLATLDGLVADLVPLTEAPASTALAPASDPDPETTEALELARSDNKTFVAILSGVERRGAWRVPRKTRLVALMGGAELDFREAVLPPGVSELKVVAVMGGADIIVPPGLAVECDGWAVLGGFEEMTRAPVVPDPSKPLLRITGYCLMGGFEIQTRLVGESARDARKRRRREKKALAKQRALELKEAERKQLSD